MNPASCGYTDGHGLIILPESPSVDVVKVQMEGYVDKGTSRVSSLTIYPPLYGSFPTYSVQQCLVYKYCLDEINRYLGPPVQWEYSTASPL